MAAKKKSSKEKAVKKIVTNYDRYTGSTSEDRAQRDEAEFRKFEAGYCDRSILTPRAAYEHAKFLARIRQPKDTY